MPAIKHVHTYERQNKTWYRCIHPDCTHKYRTIDLMGKRAMCKCGRTYILDRFQLRLKVPHCQFCTRGKKGEMAIAISEMIEQLPESFGLENFENLEQSEREFENMERK